MSSTGKRKEHPSKEKDSKKLREEKDATENVATNPNMETIVKINKEAARLAAGKGKEEWKNCTELLELAHGGCSKSYSFVCEYNVIESKINRIFSNVQDNFFDVLSERDIVRTAPLYQSQPCENPTCRYNERYSNGFLKCPYDDDDEDEEGTHCDICGNLDVMSKGYLCAGCEEWACVDCCHLHIWVDDDGICDCKHQEGIPDWFIDEDYAAICPKCFLAHKELHCTDPECKCKLKRADVVEKWRKHQHKMALNQRKWALRPKKPSEDAPEN